MKIGIYMILNTATNKRYIGSSKNIVKRWQDHRNELKRNSHYNSYLQHSWNKYTAAKFEFSILEITTIDQLQERENYWCEVFESHKTDRGYNMAPIVRGGDISENHICKTESYKQYKRNLCTNKKKVYLTNLHGELVNIFPSHVVAASTLGTTITHIHFLTKGKVRLFKSQYMLWDSLSFTTTNIQAKIVLRNQSRFKEVYQFTLQGKFIKKYDSIKQAIQQTSLNTISDCLRGKQLQSGGFLWSYFNTPPTYDPTKIYQYSLDKELIASFKSVPEAAAQTNSTVGGIRKVIYGDRNKHNGYIWSNKLL